MKQENVHIVCPEFAAETIEILSDLLRGLSASLCEDGYLLAPDRLECFMHMRVRPILVGSIPPGYALVGGMAKQCRQTGDSQFPALTRVSTPATRSRAHKHPRHRNLARSEQDTVSRALSGILSRGDMPETAARCQGGKHFEKMAPFHDDTSDVEPQAERGVKYGLQIVAPS